MSIQEDRNKTPREMAMRHTLNFNQENNLRPALSHKDSLLRINELIEERDYWKLRYEAARDTAIEQSSLNIITTIGNQKMMKDVDAEIERRIKENK